ncbi:hypothetical protein SeMB42_g07360 [Synchytrium endobioticum]|uniref:Uncharacterized protein n=1 Tax=Synchytrium endobioticum TaxID=286115 RepID=A0A507C7X6_9FUNG|nr:hypothetical protein SeMB42_g07360 [Synchytrium endobioticum]
MATEHLEEPTNDMSLNRLELGFTRQQSPIAIPITVLDRDSTWLVESPAKEKHLLWSPLCARKMVALTSMSMHSILIILLLLHQAVADPVDDTDEHLKNLSEVLMRARWDDYEENPLPGALVVRLSTKWNDPMRQELSGEWTDIINLVIEDICHEGIQLTTEHLEEPTNDMSLNRLELGYEAAHFVICLLSNTYTHTYKTTFDRLRWLSDQYEKSLKEKLFEALTGTPGAPCMPDNRCYIKHFENYIPIAGERERAADKLMELKRSGELVVSSIFRASHLLNGIHSWEEYLSYVVIPRDENPDTDRIHYASNYLELAAQKLNIIVKQVSRFLKKTETSAPPGSWEGSEICRFRVRLGPMEEVRKKYRDEAEKYEAHLKAWTESYLSRLKHEQREIARVGTSKVANLKLSLIPYGCTLKSVVIVLLQLPYPVILSPEYLELAACVVRGYPKYLRLLSLARDNPEELEDKDISLERLERAKIQINNQNDYGRGVLALYKQAKDAGVEGQKYHILFWRLELVILAVSPFVEMPRFSKYGSLIDDRGIRERLLRLQHRRNEYLPYVWKELTDGNIEIYHQKIQSKIQELKNALEPMAIEDLQSILNVDSEDAVSGRYGLSTEVITMFQQMPPDNVRPEYLELAAVYHSYYSQLLECAQKVGYDEFWQRWGDQNALWSEYYSAAVRARDRDLQEDLEAYFENWGLPEDTAGDDGNNQVSMEAAPVDPLEHSGCRYYMEFGWDQL